MYIFPFTLFTQQYTPILLLFSARINSRELTGSLYNFTPYLNTGKKVKRLYSPIWEISKLISQR
jgi:hypothetical protein